MGSWSVVKKWFGVWIRHSQREKLLAALSLLLLAAFSASMATKQLQKSTLSRSTTDCHFPAIFNFGDSNSDTGTVYAAFGRLQPPFGRTFFGKPSGRYSDGRLIIDFIAEKLGLPYLNAYLDSIGTNYVHGANFAASGSSIRPNPSMNPINLKVQLSQFEQFRARTVELLDQVSSKVAYARNSLPRPDEFSKALYIIDIGQNDIHGALTSMAEEQVQTFIPTVIDDFASAVEELYKHGARSFWIHNTGPIGCLPFFLKNYPPNSSDLDKNGCIKSYNEVSQGFNKQLKDKIFQLRTELSDAILVYVDIYTVKYTLITEAKENSFTNPLGYCCGQYGTYSVECGENLVVNGTEVHGVSCSNPAEYISWDSIHYTEAANQWVAHRILGSSSVGLAVLDCYSHWVFGHNDTSAAFRCSEEVQRLTVIRNFISIFALVMEVWRAHSVHGSISGPSYQRRESRWEQQTRSLIMSGTCLVTMIYTEKSGFLFAHLSFIHSTKSVLRFISESVSDALDFAILP